MLRRTALFAATAAIAALALTACTASPDSGATNGTGDADPNASITVGLVLEPDNLDIRHTSGAALEQALIDNVYQGLVTRAPDDDNAVVAALASDWDVSTDGLTYTFTIQDGVTFHSGDPLTIDDVVASLTAVKDDETIQGHGDFANVASISAPDDSTVEIVLTEPNINFLFTLTGRAGLVVKAGDTTDLKTAENGTGPFTISDWEQGDSLVLARYDDYWGQPAGVAEVVLQYIPDFTAGVNAALDGSLDVLTAVDPNLASQLDGTDFTLSTGQTTDKGTLAFNNKRAPLNDARVREALRLAIDHDALVEAQGSAQTLFGPIPPLDPGYEDLSDVAPYDPEKAKALLAEAGQENLQLTLTIPSFYGTTVPTYLVSAFDEIGVTLEVDSVEFPTWLQDVYTNKDYDLSFVLHVEARDFGNFANPDYYFQYDNREVQDLYAQALATTDADESADLLKQAARIVSEDNAADWLYLGNTITAVGSGVSGFPVNSINVRLNLADVTVSRG
ncbi:ABC transporter substrate-binding protein [Microbacterium sp. BWT-B31]|uniref:ABC transporter substrate-binding protein n=1 Tax=Microbacterium sp. BWT-B31 TaxID=3232072 RepID=UPI003526D9CC